MMTNKELILANLMRAMIKYDGGDAPRIQHFVKVHDFARMIADYSNIMPLVEKAEFPDELVLNYQPEKFMAYLKPTPEK
jgi:hypothetical protein